MTVQEIAKELRGQDVWSVELLELLCDDKNLQYNKKKRSKQKWKNMR